MMLIENLRAKFCGFNLMAGNQSSTEHVAALWS